MIDANGGWQDKKGSAATRGQGLRKQSGCELSASWILLANSMINAIND